MLNDCRRIIRSRTGMKLKMIGGLIFTLLLGTLYGQEMSLSAPAQIAVSPSRVEVDLSGSASTHSLRLHNFAEDPVNVEVSVVTWDLDDNNRVRLLPPDEQTLDQWIVINPTRFVVGGKSSQAVRFSVRPRVKPEPGEHRAMIYLEQVFDGPADPSQVQVNFKIGVAVYGYVGQVERNGELRDLSVLANESILGAKFNIASTGNAHVRMSGKFAIWASDSFPGTDTVMKVADLDGSNQQELGSLLVQGVLPGIPVLAGTYRDVPLNLRHGLPPGDYVFAVAGDLAGSSFAEVARFNVPIAVPEDPLPGRVVEKQSPADSKQEIVEATDELDKASTKTAGKSGSGG